MKNAAKGKYYVLEGTYILSGSKVNGRPYWNQEGKSNAIWYDTNNYWIINDKGYIGHAQGLLWNADSTAPCPNSGNWLFWDWEASDWIYNTNEIIIKIPGNPKSIYIYINLKFKC